MSKIFRLLIFVVCMMAGLQSGAQLVDHATFEQHRAAAHSFGGTLHTAASAPIILSQNPFELEQFSINNSGTAQVKLYFNTAVMANYRSQCCPRVGEFQLALPAGCSVTAVTRGADLQSSITVTGNFDTDARTLYFLAYGMCSASQMLQFPTGRIHYATITIKTTNASPGTKTMTMSNAAFSMADEPSEFIISGTTNYSFSVVQLVTGISLNKTSATINNGETLQLTYSVTPSNASNKTVTWSSSNTNVATVSSGGLVTAKSCGTATITATTRDGSNLSASCAITVNQLATGISLNKTSATINNGETLQLTATVTPSNTNNKNVTWKSSNTSVATVSSSGLVTAKGGGTATITASTADGSNLRATCEVTVNQPATGISLNKTTASLVVDKTLQLTATVSPSNANNKTVAWTSSNTAIATVDNTGLVTAKSVGSATITATTSDGTNLSASCKVTVTPQLATDIALNQTLAEIGVGETVTLVATVSPNNTTNPSVKWTTENAAVATVVRGVVRGVGEGECYITATTQDGTNLSAQCLVAVWLNHPISIAGDVDGNGAVNGTDLNILINIILGKDNAANYSGRANVNGEGGIDGNDLNKLINIILGK